MKLKLDENISRHLKEILTALRHDVTTAAEEELLGQADTTVAKAAKTEGRVLLTLDLEFADLRKYPPGFHPGIVLFRPKGFGPLAVNRFIEEFFRSADIQSLEGCVVIVEPSQVRVRRPAVEDDLLGQ